MTTDMIAFPAEISVSEFKERPVEIEYRDGVRVIDLTPTWIGIANSLIAMNPDLSAGHRDVIRQIAEAADKGVILTKILRSHGVEISE